jgi:hypothetical protein
MTDYWERERERIMIQVKRMLDHRFPSPTVCKFHAVCSGYRKEAFTCQHEEESKYYCGLYKRHEAQIYTNGMKKMLEGTDFGDFDV